jgi:ribonuclease P protein component
MFSRQYRLPSSQSSFEKVIRSPYFTLKVARNSLPHNRYGFIVSKRVNKLAVARNKIRRQLQQCMLELQLQIITGNDILIIATPTLLSRSHDEILQELIKTFKKNALIV